MPLGGGEHDDHLRYPRYWTEYCFSSLEHKQFAGNFLGIRPVQRTARCRTAALGERHRRRVLMFAGATLLAFASSAQMAAEHATRGILAALCAGILWGTMYIPYRKAYLTGMNPLSFVTFFTIGELGMMTVLALGYGGGPSALWREFLNARPALFWLMLGGFVWVIGDLFQQYAAKYVGISRGIPLSNSNQLWGLLW